MSDGSHVSFFRKKHIAVIYDYFSGKPASGNYWHNLINKKLGMEPVGDKAGFIAMHIINAKMGTNMGQVPNYNKDDK